MQDFITNSIQPYFNYWVYVILMMIGLWAVIAKNNLIKKLIGMSIFQTAIILFYVSIGVKEGSKIPIIIPGASYEAHATADQHYGDDKTKEKSDTSHSPKAEGKHGADGKKGGYSAKAIDPDLYANPLPHVLMLTAIVVGVSTLGVALAVSQLIFKDFGTLEENEILAQIEASKTDG